MFDKRALELRGAKIRYAELKEESDAILQAYPEIGLTERRAGRKPGRAATPRRAGARVMSADARARIGAAQRARWAKQKGQVHPASVEQPVAMTNEMAAGTGEAGETPAVVATAADKPTRARRSGRRVGNRKK